MYTARYIGWVGWLAGYVPKQLELLGTLTLELSRLVPLSYYRLSGSDQPPILKSRGISRVLIMKASKLQVFQSRAGALETGTASGPRGGRSGKLRRVVSTS